MINAVLHTTISNDTHTAILCREVDLPAAPTAGLSVRFDNFSEPFPIVEVTYDVETGVYGCDCGHDDAEEDDMLDVLSESYAGWTILDISPRDTFFDEIADFEGC
jgi:hypothetical protein